MLETHINFENLNISGIRINKQANTVWLNLRLLFIIVVIIKEDIPNTKFVVRFLFWHKIDPVTEFSSPLAYLFQASVSGNSLFLPARRLRTCSNLSPFWLTCDLSKKALGLCVLKSYKPHIHYKPSIHSQRAC